MSDNVHCVEHAQRRRLKLVLYLSCVLLFLGSAGLLVFQLLPHYVNQTYRVLDNESRKPIEGIPILVPAEGLIFAPWFAQYFQPHGDSQITDHGGFATLRITKDRRNDFRISPLDEYRVVALDESPEQIVVYITKNSPIGDGTLR